MVRRPLGCVGQKATAVGEQRRRRGETAGRGETVAGGAAAAGETLFVIAFLPL